MNPKMIASNRLMPNSVSSTIGQAVSAGRIRKLASAAGALQLPTSQLAPSPPSARLGRWQATPRRFFSVHTTLRDVETHASTSSAGQIHRVPPSAAASASSSLPTLSTDASLLRVTWPSGIESRFHHIWLRDHCRCVECFHPKTKQRLLNTFQVSSIDVISSGS